MSDVRLVATNPDDGTLVPVASNASGQLAVQSPKIEKVPNDFDVEGDLTVTGDASVRGNVVAQVDDNASAFVKAYAAGYFTIANATAFGQAFGLYDTTEDSFCVSFSMDGGGMFTGDVCVGSRNKKWMLVEQGGLCHMVEQVRASTADLVDPAVDPAVGEYPKLRDVFAELDLVEKALEQVMEKLKMVEPDGWPVWDGSDNS